jgi:hypothetical protein
MKRPIAHSGKNGAAWGAPLRRVAIDSERVIGYTEGSFEVHSWRIQNEERTDFCTFLRRSCNASDGGLRDTIGVYPKRQRSGHDADMPVHLGEQQEPGTIRVSAGASAYPVTSFNGRINYYTPVNSKGVFQVDTSYDNGTPVYHLDNGDTHTFSGTNFHAAYPGYSLAAGIDVAYTKHASLVGGVQYTTLNGNEYDAEYLGVGLTSADSVRAIRADFGLRLSSTRFALDYVVITTPFSFEPSLNQSTAEFHSVSAENEDVNFYCSVVVNSNFPGSSFDFFLRGGFVRQTEFNYAADEFSSNDAEYTTSLISFTPGVIFNLSPTTRLLAGVVFAHDTNSDNATSFRPMPLGQFEFRF